MNLLAIFMDKLTTLRRIEREIAELKLLVQQLLPGPAVDLGAFYEEDKDMPFNLPDDTPKLVKLDPTDLEQRHGAKLDAAPVWVSSDPATMTVTPAADGLSAVIAYVPGGPGATASWTATTTSGGGANQLSDTDVVTIVAGNATAMPFTYEDVPAPAPADPNAPAAN